MNNYQDWNSLAGSDVALPFLTAARLTQGHEFLAVIGPIRNGAAVSTAARSLYPTTDLEKAGWLELTLAGADGRKELERLSERLGERIPDDATCCALTEGPGLLERVLLRVPAVSRGVIVDALRRTGIVTHGAAALKKPSPIPGYPALAVRLRGLTLIAFGVVPEAPQKLLDFLVDYPREQHRVAWERAWKEQEAQASIEIPASARKLRFDVRLQHGATYLALKAGAIVVEPDLIEVINASDPDALIAIDDKTNLRALKAGQMRYRSRFIGTVPRLGFIDAQEGRIVDGVDASYVAALRRVGADVEWFADETPRIEAPRAKKVSVA